MTYFEWLNKQTDTKWWHDSASPQEIELAISRGAKGVTTNPVLTYRTFKNEPDYWKEKVSEIPQNVLFTERAEALLKLVATHAASMFEDEFISSNGQHGFALGQLNPEFAADADKMFEQAVKYHSWGNNIAIKLPATHAGIVVIEKLAAKGIPICATLNVSVSQAIHVAEAYEKGRKEAIKNGIEPSICLVVQQVGRLDDYLRDIAKDLDADVSEEDIVQAGIAVCKRTYQIFVERNYNSIIMPAGLRGINQVTELAGGKVIFSLQTRVQNMILEANPPQVERIAEPVDSDVIERLMTMKEFKKAYEPDGMGTHDYITYGVIQKLLSQFMETGWSPLETYGSKASSSRWF